MTRPVTTAAVRLFSAALVLAVLPSVPATAQTNTTLPIESISKVDAAIASLMSRQNIPALSIAIVEDGNIRFQHAYGMADIENSVPAKPTTVYRIASVAKTITGVAAMQLAEQGRLDLDAPVQKYAPSFPTKAFPITTRQVLAHLSGIRHYKPGEGEHTSHYETLTDALDVFKDDSLEHEPGTRFTYSTFGYTLLGVIIEGASGMTFGEYLRERIFKPSGMQHTYLDDPYDIILNRARGYAPKVYGKFDGNVRNAALMDASYKIPGGGLVSTAEDLARFAIALQSGVLIKQETVEQMWRSQKTSDGRETGYGYGWFIDRREGRQPDGSVWHGGVQPGFTSDFWILPRKHFALVILTNLEGGGRLGLGALANQIADIVLQ